MRVVCYFLVSFFVCFIGIIIYIVQRHYYAYYSLIIFGDQPRTPLLLRPQEVPSVLPQRSKKAAFNKLQLFIYTKTQILFYIFQKYKAKTLALFGSFCCGKKNNRINKFFYLQGFAPHPSSFIGIKEPKELHLMNYSFFMYNKIRYYFIY